MNQGSELCGEMEEEYSRERGSMCTGSKEETGSGSSRRRGRAAGLERTGVA